MKNLVYYISNSRYKHVLKLSIEQLKKHNPEIDICVIASLDLSFDSSEPSPDYIFYQSILDFVHTAKCSIIDWDRFKNYDNFLFIDCDVIPTKNILPVFETIYNNKEYIHGVQEYPFINKCAPGWSKYDENIIFDDNPPAFNAGTFGFNKNLIEEIILLRNEIENNRNNAICDQAVYNQFFLSKKILKPTLSQFVYLFGHDTKHPQQPTMRTAHMVHFFGNAYGGKNVDSIREHLQNNNLI